ncbi:2-aminoethylphosphonate--pyruvate transaminase [Terasakiella pusilla]|uniref:2-aminoethylphosphonate--pyruvate transaminase n=1 Tax=Terasakiella pusilla TaxID=64973 RepID=UPI003AA98178
MTNRPEHYLLTPGPLTTSMRVKEAMLTDWGSWDEDFQALTRQMRAGVCKAAGVDDSYTCVPLQGSGTFAVEAAISTLVGRTGKLLVLINGAYGERIVKICTCAGIAYDTLTTPETQAASAEQVDEILHNDPNITHVAIVQCETSIGIMNKTEEIAQTVKAHNRRLIIDAMSAFGVIQLDPVKVPYDAIIASANKCLEGVPGAGFVVVKTDALKASKGNCPSLSLDLVDQWEYMEKTGQWRFTPPTHVISAFIQALDEYEAEGGAKARLARYTLNKDTLVAEMRAAGFQTLLPDEDLSPIIVTFLAPDEDAYEFKAFYQAVKERGFLIYPGKMTEVESFRIGCIGHFDHTIMREAVTAIQGGLRAIGVTNFSAGQLNSHAG